MSWSAAGRVVSQLAQVVLALILARVLTPADFGVYAAVLVFAAFGQVLAQSGLAQALVQAKAPSQGLLSTAFWLHALISGSLTIMTGILGPTLGRVFHSGQVESMAWLVGLNYLLGLNVVPIALMQRQMRFRELAIAETSSVVLGGVIAVVVAFAGGGAYSLVFQQLGMSITLTALVSIFVRWIPGVRPSVVHGRQLIRVSSGLLLANIMTFWSRNADNFIIGRSLGLEPLGLYSRAYSLMMLPLTQVTWVVTRVMLPVLARVSDDQAALRRVYLRSVEGVALATMPLSLTIAMCGQDLVDIALGKRWSAAGPIVTVLALASYTQGVGSTISWIFQVRGKNMFLSIWSFATSVAAVGSFIIGARFGVIGVCFGYLIVNLVFLPISFQVASSLLHARWNDLYVACWRPALVSLLTVLPAGLVKMGLAENATLMRLSASLVAAGIAFVFGARLVCWGPGRAVLEALSNKRTGLSLGSTSLRPKTRKDISQLGPKEGVRY